jgi:hypothetical protein
MASLTTLGSVLEAVVGHGPLLTIQPGGNYGDRLIDDGFGAFLPTTGVRAVPFSSDEFRRDAPTYTPPARDGGRNVSALRSRLRYLADRVRHSPAAVYIHGGGTFTDVWATGIRCYRLVCRLFDCPVEVGPRSCQLDATDPHPAANAYRLCAWDDEDGYGQRRWARHRGRHRHRRGGYRFGDRVQPRALPPL